MGGAIFSNKTMIKFINCSFINNTATYGSAIVIYNSSMNMSGCHFINNTATYGYTIWIWYGSMNVSGCYFINNTADSVGGAIGNDVACMDVSGCYFINNTADSFGGAICNVFRAIINVSGCHFINNNATNGGAISANYGSMNVSGCYFINNTANRGGAIYSDAVNLNVSGCDFINNTATSGEGSAIYNIVYGATTRADANYNRFLNNSGYTIFNNNTWYIGNFINMNYNWWGSNENPSQYVNGGVTLDNWFVMQLSANNITTLNNSGNNTVVGGVNLSYQLVLFDNTTINTSVVPYENLPDFYTNLTWIFGNVTITELVNAKGYYSKVFNFNNDWEIAKIVNITNNASLGDEIQYTITLKNNGLQNAVFSLHVLGDNEDIIISGNAKAGDTVNEVNVTDILNPKLIYLDSYSTNGGSYDNNTGLWSIPNIAPGQNATLTIRAKINGTGLISNIATMGEISSQADVNVTKLVNFTVSKVLNIANTTNVINGDYVTYTITVTNNGPDIGTNVKLNEQLPKSLLYQKHTVSVGNYNPTTGVWNIGNLAVGETVTMTITVKVKGTGDIINGVNITSDQQNINNETNNKTITAKITVKDSIKTNLVVTAKFKNNYKTMEITGVLTDEFGNLLVNKTIDFYVNGKYVGSAITNNNGVAVFDYNSNTPFKNGVYYIYGEFTGDELYLPSNDTTSLEKNTNDTNKTNKTDNVSKVTGSGMITSTSASDNVAMKKTGVPLMVIAVLMFLSVFVTRMRKQN